MQLQITATRPFGTSSGQALGINFLLNGQPNEGVIWGHPVQASIATGSLIEVKEDNNIKWDNYKGANRLNIRDRATITVLTAGGAPPAAQQAPQQQYQQPAPQQTYQAPQQATQTHSGGVPGNKAEEVLLQGAAHVRFFVESLEGQGFTREEALQLAAPQAAGLYPLYWFGEKGVQ